MKLSVLKMPRLVLGLDAIVKKLMGKIKLKKEDFCPLIVSITNITKSNDMEAGGHIVFTLLSVRFLLLDDIF